jgi:hypothetical protein
LLDKTTVHDLAVLAIEEAEGAKMDIKNGLVIL